MFERIFVLCNLIQRKYGIIVRCLIAVWDHLQTAPSLHPRKYYFRCGNILLEKTPLGGLFLYPPKVGCIFFG